MSTKPNPIPAAYAGGVPYLVIDGAAKALEFYAKAFGATEVMRMPFGDGIGHAEIRIGTAPIMLADANCGASGVGDPKKLGGTSVSLVIYVEDVDAFSARAVVAGAEIVQPLETRFYGDRVCLLRDPFGHLWNFSTHVEDVSPEELGKRAAAFLSKS